MAAYRNRFPGLGAMIAAALIGGDPRSAYVDFLEPKAARKPSKKYPHSSTRQRARYARQIAAGKLRFV